MNKFFLNHREQSDGLSPRKSLRFPYFALTDTQNLSPSCLQWSESFPAWADWWTWWASTLLNFTDFLHTLPPVGLEGCSGRDFACLIFWLLLDLILAAWLFVGLDCYCLSAGLIPTGLTHSFRSQTVFWDDKGGHWQFCWDCCEVPHNYLGAFCYRKCVSPRLHSNAIFFLARTCGPKLALTSFLKLINSRQFHTEC